MSTNEHIYMRVCVSPLVGHMHVYMQQQMCSAIGGKKPLAITDRLPRSGTRQEVLLAGH
jgi:hypothetical protein